MLEFLIWFVSCLLTALGYTYLYYKINDIKIEFKIKIIVIFLLGVVTLTVLKFYNFARLGSFIFLSFYPLLFYIIKSSKVKKLIFNVIVIWLYGILLDFSSMFIISILYFLLKIDLNNLVYVLLPSIYVFVMSIVLANIKPIIRFLNFLYKLLNKIKYADFMLVIFSVFLFIIGTIFAINIKSVNTGFLSIFLAVLIVIVFALLIRTKYSEMENEIFIGTLRKNNDFYINMDKEQSIFKHNLISKLLSVESVSNKKARVLIQELIKDFNSNIDYSQKMTNIPYGLDGIINEKIYPYNDFIEIKVDNKIAVDIFNVIKPRRYNVLVEKLSLILDNALEACLNSADKIVVINLYEEHNSIVIEIKNSFSEILNVDDLGKVNYSSKGKKRGFGLYSALRNNEVDLKLKIINNMFVAKLTVIKNLICE